MNVIFSYRFANIGNDVTQFPKCIHTYLAKMNNFALIHNIDGDPGRLYLTSLPCVVVTSLPCVVVNPNDN